MEFHVLDNDLQIFNAFKNGRTRGYQGLKLQRPRTVESIDLGGYQMMQRVRNYVSRPKTTITN